MTLLAIWPDSAPDEMLVSTTDPTEIAAELATVGIAFDQWPTVANLPVGATQEDVFAAYRTEVDSLVSDHGFTVIDVAQIHPNDDPAWPETAAGARGKFLEEHTHAEDEVRFFVQGAGVFYLHLDGRVLALYCEAGDLVSVPALTTHWFDMGTRPDFTAIRFFKNADGWVGSFTGNPIAKSYSDFDTLAALRG